MIICSRVSAKVYLKKGLFVFARKREKCFGVFWCFNGVLLVFFCFFLCVFLCFFFVFVFVFRALPRFFGGLLFALSQAKPGIPALGCSGHLGIEAAHLVYNRTFRAIAHPNAVRLAPSVFQACFQAVLPELAQVGTWVLSEQVQQSASVTKLPSAEWLLGLIV